MFKRKTLKRLTRFTLCLYMLIYCMGFTVCAEGIPDTGKEYALGAPVIEEGEARNAETPEAEEPEEAVKVESVEDDEPEVLREATADVEYTGTNTSGLNANLGLNDYGKNTVLIQNDLEADITDPNGLVINMSGPKVITFNGQGHKITPKSGVSGISDHSLLPFGASNATGLVIKNLVFSRTDTSAAETNPIGAAIDLSSCNAEEVTIQNCTFNGIKGYMGGAVYQGSNTKLIIDNCTFRECEAFDYGGAVYGEGGKSLTVKNCVFIENGISAPESDGGEGGGAIYKGGPAPLSVTNCSFINNFVQEGLSGSAVFAECDADIEKCVFLKNEGDPVVKVYDGSVMDCWFGHTELDYNKTFSGVQGASELTYRFLNLSKYVQWNSGAYSMQVDTNGVYNPISRNITNGKNWKLPNVTLNCSAEGCVLEKGTVDLIYNSSSNYRAAYTPITGFSSGYYNLSLTDFGYKKSFNRTLTVQAAGIYYNGKHTITVYGDGNEYTVDGKNVTMAVDKVGTFTAPIKMDSWWPQFNVYFGDKAAPGTYDVTYTVDGFAPLKTNITVERADLNLAFSNGTAENANKSGKYPIWDPFSYTSGSGTLLRTNIYGMGNGGQLLVNRGTVYVYNGTTKMSDKDKIIFSSAVSEEKQYVDLDLDSLEPGRYNISAVYTDETGCYNNISIMDPHDPEHPSSYAAHIAFNITDNRSDAGVAIKGEKTITKTEGDPAFKLNVSVAKPGTGTGKYYWTSTNETVAVVSDEGTVTVKKAGTAAIRVRYVSDTTSGSAEIKLTVLKGSGGDDPSLKDAGVSIKEGNSLTKTLGDPGFRLNVTAADPGEGTGTWTFTSSNASVATVDEKGSVSLKGAGITNITAEYRSDTTYGKAVLVLTVKESSTFAPFEPVKVDGTNITVGIEISKNITFTGNKFKAKDIKDLGNGTYSIAGLTIKVDSPITAIADPKFKFKNIKHASENSKPNKKPQFTISFKKKKGLKLSKQNKTDIKKTNKAFKKKPVPFFMDKVDLAKTDKSNPVTKVTMNGKKTKVKKAVVVIDGKTFKLKKKDYTSTISDNKIDITLTGRGDFKNEVSLPMS